MKAFVQWTGDELRLGADPSLTPFPVDRMAKYTICRYKTNEKYITDSKTLSDEDYRHSSRLTYLACLL
jgi:hypothetical protein